MVLAQQRLAQAKNTVAHQQHIASSKEAHAAAALQRVAQEAAAEIQKAGEEHLFCLRFPSYSLSSSSFSSSFTVTMTHKARGIGTARRERCFVF